MMKRFQFNIAQSGVSTVTLAITVLAGSILIFGALAGYNYVAHAKIDNEILMLSSLKRNTMRLGQSVGNLTSTNTTLDILNKMNFFNDPTLKVSGSGASVAITNQWGGAVTVGVNAAGVNIVGDSLNFTFSGIPNDICYQVASKVDSIAAIITVGASNTLTKAGGAATNLATLNTACGNKGTVQSITYTFLR